MEDEEFWMNVFTILIADNELDFSAETADKALEKFRERFRKDINFEAERKGYTDEN